MCLLLIKPHFPPLKRSPKHKHGQMRDGRTVQTRENKWEEKVKRAGRRKKALQMAAELLQCLFLSCLCVWMREKCVKKQETAGLGTVPRDSWSNVWEIKRRWGLIKKEQGREWKKALVWFLEINKDFLLHTHTLSLFFFLSWVDDERHDSLVVFKNEQWSLKSLLLHPPYTQWKGWNGEIKGKDMTAP